MCETFTLSFPMSSHRVGNFFEIVTPRVSQDERSFMTTKQNSLVYLNVALVGYFELVTRGEYVWVVQAAKHFSLVCDCSLKTSLNCPRLAKKFDKKKFRTYKINTIPQEYYFLLFLISQSIQYNPKNT